jgi:hypothetical protein
MPFFTNTEFTVVQAKQLVFFSKATYKKMVKLPATSCHIQGITHKWRCGLDNLGSIIIKKKLLQHYYRSLNLF